MLGKQIFLRKIEGAIQRRKKEEKSGKAVRMKYGDGKTGGKPLGMKEERKRE